MEYRVTLPWLSNIYGSIFASRCPQTIITQNENSNKKLSTNIIWTFSNSAIQNAFLRWRVKIIIIFMTMIRKVETSKISPSNLHIPIDTIWRVWINHRGRVRQRRGRCGRRLRTQLRLMHAAFSSLQKNSSDILKNQLTIYHTQQNTHLHPHTLTSDTLTQSHILEQTDISAYSFGNIGKGTYLNVNDPGKNYISYRPWTLYLSHPEMWSRRSSGARKRPPDPSGI